MTSAVETWLEDLSQSACRHHLASAVVGRLCVIVDGHPDVFPVNHVYDEETGSIAFPSNSGTKLQAAIEQSSVAFEVDGFDAGARSAWSVVAIGGATELTDRAQIRRAEAGRGVRWALAADSRWIRIVPERLTGRRISAIPASGVLPAVGLAAEGEDSSTTRADGRDGWDAVG